LKFCMVTTFFGAHSFGGDAAYVDRLARALCRRGHEVHVFHCADAFNAVRGKHPLRPYAPPRGLHVHRLESGLGVLSPLATQVTGEPYFKAEMLKALDAVDTDVVHFHNISLVGGPGVLRTGRAAVRLMTAHEHWLICPMHLLWKYGRKACDAPTCLRCSVAGGRPPQAWRYTGAIDRGLRELDALIFPSRHTLEEHRRRGIRAPMVYLPYFLPDDWSEGIEDEDPEPSARPYLAAAGRLVRMKGFQRLIPMMRLLPEVDLRIAGTGPYEAELRALAQGLPNVRFEGLLGGSALAIPLPRDVRLRRARSLRRPDPGGGRSARRGPARDGRAQRRRPGLRDRRRAAPGAPAHRPRSRPPRRAGLPRLRDPDRRMVRDRAPRPLLRPDPGDPGRPVVDPVAPPTADACRHRRAARRARGRPVHVPLS
jgi:glycosyltransferase involved in cell wall biosynthesis